MKLYVVRHGETDSNAQGRAGNNPPLNSSGIKQAEALGKKIRDSNISFELVYSSPKQRTLKTAAIVSGKTPTADERIDGYHLGEAEGIKKEDLDIKAIISGTSKYKGVENVYDYEARVRNFIEDIIQKYEKTDFNILICGHECTTGYIESYFQGNPNNHGFLKFALPNCEYRVYEK